MWRSAKGNQVATSMSQLIANVRRRGNVLLQACIAVLVAPSQASAIVMRQSRCVENGVAKIDGNDVIHMTQGVKSVCTDYQSAENYVWRVTCHVSRVGEFMSCLRHEK